MTSVVIDPRDHADHANEDVSNVSLDIDHSENAQFVISSVDDLDSIILQMTDGQSGSSVNVSSERSTYKFPITTTQSSRSNVDLRTSQQVMTRLGELRNDLVGCLLDIYEFNLLKRVAQTTRTILPTAMYGLQPDMQQETQQLKSLMQRYNKTLYDINTLQVTLVHHSHAQKDLFTSNLHVSRQQNEKRMSIIQELRKKSCGTKTLVHMLIDSLLHLHEEEHRCNDKLFILGKDGMDQLLNSHQHITSRSNTSVEKYLQHIKQQCDAVTEAYQDNWVSIQAERRLIAGTLGDPHVPNGSASILSVWKEYIVQLQSWTDGQTSGVSGVSSNELSKQLSNRLMSTAASTVPGQIKEVFDFVEHMTPTECSAVVASDVGCVAPSTMILALEERIVDKESEIVDIENHLNNLLLVSFKFDDTIESRASRPETQDLERSLSRQLFESKEELQQYGLQLKKLQKQRETQAIITKEESRDDFDRERSRWVQRIVKIQSLYDAQITTQSKQGESFVRLEYGLQEECRQALHTLQMTTTEILVQENMRMITEENINLVTVTSSNTSKQKSLQTVLVQLLNNREQYIKQLSIMDPSLTYSLFNLNSIELNLQGLRESNLLILALSKLASFIHHASRTLDCMYHQHVQIWLDAKTPG